MVAAGAPHEASLAGPFGDLEVLTRGSGHPSSVFVHGLGGSIATTRPYAGSTPGRRTFAHIAGHGRSSPPSPMTYAALAREVWAVADHAEATAVLGVSMGAAAICAGLADDPARFRAVVLVLPAVLDRPREDAAMSRLRRWADLVEAGDVEALTRELAALEPPEVAQRPDVAQWCAEQAGRLAGGGASAALRAIPQQAPLQDVQALRAVRTPVLVLGQSGDELHPVSVARDLAAVLPEVTVEVLPEGGIMWAHRSRVRELVGKFLATHAA